MSGHWQDDGVPANLGIVQKGPNMRPNVLHGILAPRVLRLRASTVMLVDLDEKQEALGTLWPGATADLNVLYGPCAGTVRFVSLASSQVELFNWLSCRSP